MNTLISDNMSKKILTVSWTDTLSSAYEKMKKYNVRHLVAVDNFDYAMGILSDKDCYRAMLTKSNLSRLQNGDQFSSDAYVKDFMSWPIETAESTDSLLTVAQGMLSKKISAYLIMKNDEPVGIITTDDLMHILVKMLEAQASTKINTMEEIIYTLPIGSVVNSLSQMGI